MVRGAHDDGVVSVTTAPMSRQEEQSTRQRRYLFSMSLRAVCFIGALVVGDHWYRWVLIAGALILPYVAVVAANAVTGTLPAGTPESPGLSHPELPSAR